MERRGLLLMYVLHSIVNILTPYSNIFRKPFYKTNSSYIIVLQHQGIHPLSSMINALPILNTTYTP